MPVPEARLQSTEAGLVPASEGWFVVNVADAAGTRYNPRSAWVRFESTDHPFPHYGVNIHVLEPGEPNSLYHEESDQEDFLVLSGECILVVEEQERRLKAWDYVHCAPGTRHTFVGAGEGPCAILMIGARAPDKRIHYPVSELAARHGASAVRPADSGRDAYPEAGWSRDFTAEKLPWPPEPPS